MVISGLLVAEWCANRIGKTSKLDLGLLLLDLCKSMLGNASNAVGSSVCFFLHYVTMVGYAARGGVPLNNIIGLSSDAGQIMFEVTMCSRTNFLNFTAIEQIDNFLIAIVCISFVSILH